VANDWDKVISELNLLKRSDRGMRIALSTVLARQKQRIFNRGQAANSQKIGSYSTKPASISRKNQARSTGKTYFAGGYAEYKRAIGKNPGFVNLRNTDQMMIDYGVEILGNNTYGLGFSNDFNFDKSQWMEEKYRKDIFDETKQEGELMEKILIAELNRIMP
jgi:hypothetical protein